jgi:hypothetical protein
MNAKWKIEWIQEQIQLKVKDYNEMPDDDHHHDDALTSNDPSSDDDGSPFASSRSEPLMEVRFRGSLVALCLASQTRLHGLIIFDEAMLMAGFTVRQYGRA